MYIYSPIFTWCFQSVDFREITKIRSQIELTKLADDQLPRLAIISPLFLSLEIIR